MNTVNPAFPTVSVIVPCLNEEMTIESLLEAVYRQTYPRQQLEMIIADGLSTDLTRSKIHQFARDHPDLKITIADNPDRTIPSALNRAIRAAQGEILVRLDAHSIPYPDYIERAVHAIQAGKGDNVGGVWEIQPGKSRQGKITWIARSIAAAASNPLGVGNAQYRYTNKPQETDTVPFGVFRKQLIEKVGYFNEKLLTNEDYEFNVRIQKNGGKIWLDPSIRSIYFSRSNLISLIQQYWRYGYWKAQMLRHYPSSLRWRQALPPLFVSMVLAAAVLSIGFHLARFALFALLLPYGTLLFFAGAKEAIRRKDLALLFGVPIAIACMHISWGSAVWWSLLGFGKKNVNLTNRN